MDDVNTNLRNYGVSIPRKAQAMGVPFDNLRVMLGRRLSVSLDIKVSVGISRYVKGQGIHLTGEVVSRDCQEAVIS